MVVFSIIECLGWQNLCGEGLASFVLLLLEALFCNSLLLFVMVEDSRHILPLVAGCCIVETPEHFQQSVITGGRGIVLQLYCLSMITQIPVSWVLGGSSRVPDAGADHPRGTAILRLGEPESRERKSGLLHRNIRLVQRHLSHFAFRLSLPHGNRSYATVTPSPFATRTGEPPFRRYAVNSKNASLRTEITYRPRTNQATLQEGERKAHQKIKSNLPLYLADTAVDKKNDENRRTSRDDMTVATCYTFQSGVLAKLQS